MSTERRERVVVVDDEEAFRDVLVFNLGEAGMEAEGAATGALGFAAVARLRPAVVVLDLMLPDVSGTEVCRRIRSDPSVADTGVLMLTARGDEYDRIVGFEV